MTLWPELKPMDGEGCLGCAARLALNVPLLGCWALFFLAMKLVSWLRG